MSSYLAAIEASADRRARATVLAREFNAIEQQYGIGSKEWRDALLTMFTRAHEQECATDVIAALDVTDPSKGRSMSKKPEPKPEATPVLTEKPVGMTGAQWREYLASQKAGA